MGPQRGPPVGLGLDVQILHLQQIAGNSVLNVEGPREGMHPLAVRAELGGGHAKAHASVSGVARLQNRLFPRSHFQYWRDVWVPAV